MIAIYLSNAFFMIGWMLMRCDPFSSSFARIGNLISRLSRYVFIYRLYCEFHSTTIAMTSRIDQFRTLNCKTVSEISVHVGVFQVDRDRFTSLLSSCPLSLS